MLNHILVAGMVFASFSSPRIQGPDPKVTLTVQATSASKALIQLGNAAGATLTTSPQTAEDIITFRFKDVPFSETIKRIADAVNGSWKHEGDSLRLIGCQADPPLRQPAAQSGSKNAWNLCSKACGRKTAFYR